MNEDKRKKTGILPAEKHGDGTSGDEDQMDEFFGGVVEEEGLDASETDEDVDEGLGDGKMGRSGNDREEK